MVWLPGLVATDCESKFSFVNGHHPLCILSLTGWGYRGHFHYAHVPCFAGHAGTCGLVRSKFSQNSAFFQVAACEHTVFPQTFLHPLSETKGAGLETETENNIFIDVNF